MQPRLMIRTHYQAAEPRVLLATVTECTSPTISRDEETAARALVRWARGVGQTLSLPGALYALGNNRTLGFLSRLNRWTAAGLAFSYVCSESATPRDGWQPELGVSEQYIFLKNYLTGAGALLVKFGAWLLAESRTSHEQMRRSSVLEALYVDVLNDYLKIANQIRDRTSIRHERDRLSRTQYSTLTKRHKRYPLLAVMRRLQLLDESQGEFVPDRLGRLARLVAAIPDIRSLEHLIRDQRLRATVLHVLAGAPIEEYRPQVDRVIASGYRYAVGQGLQLCPLGFLEDILYATSVGRCVVPAASNAEQCLERWYNRFPGDVRFHVDRRGQRAFVTIENSVLDNMES